MLWYWLGLFGLGAFHGINPGMGWLFAVALGMQEKRRGAVYQALLPLAAGHALAVAAALALAVAALAIIVYLAWRFEFKFGVAATIATFHDIFSIVGIFWIFGLEQDLLFITALLTIGGYSLTDTVVVFDRIRENIRLRKRATLSETINLSVNEVLSRTIVTSVTVFLAVMALLFFGGSVLRNFALALAIGIVVGTYSSVFVASPIVAVWRGEKLIEVKR
jgi:preprotein translocase SecF subunit